jgi:hypothetical protein
MNLNKEIEIEENPKKKQKTKISVDVETIKGQSGVVGVKNSKQIIHDDFVFDFKRDTHGSVKKALNQDARLESL